MIISGNAKCSGYGTDRFKSVVGLDKDERQWVKDGIVVVVENCRPLGGNHGDRVRAVTFKRVNGRNYWGRRALTWEEFAEYCEMKEKIGWAKPHL